MKPNHGSVVKLLNEGTYNRSGSIDVLIAKVENTYETLESLKIYNNVVFSPLQPPYEIWTVPNPYNILYDLSSIQYSYMIGETEIGRKVLKQSKKTTYNEAGQNPIVSTTDYFYDNLVHKQVTRTESIGSNGKKIISKMLYPDDIKTASTLQDNSSIKAGALSTDEFNAIKKLQTPTSSNLTAQHHISTPIQTETHVDLDNDGVVDTNEPFSVQRTNYKDWDVDLGLPTNTDIVLPNDVQTLKGNYNSSNNALKDRIEFKHYYDNGNVKEISKVDGTSIYYIWGYKEQYPIAKIENFTKTQATAIQSSLINPAVTASDADIDTTTENTLRTTLNNIRNNSTLSNAMVTTYTYDPLIGVTSITDPKGYTTYYEYDDFNRLEYVKDGDGKILSKNKYHYKGQQ